MGAAGLFGPVFALFIDGFIEGGNESVAGLAVGIYLFTKSILQIPIAYLIDKVKGEKDDFWFMFIFTILISIIPLLYLIIETPLELYIVQFILGLFTAFTFPTYMAIFTRHIDKEREGMEWGLYHTLIDLMSATFAAIGGYLAFTQGFSILIITVVIISLMGSLMLLPIRKHIK
ncbi:MAG: MFS transporter [Candidatus Nanoarchaeia archaeon]|nr:MFS transporter [Candidatus Nanoarchaeia archaeon]